MFRSNEETEKLGKILIRDFEDGLRFEIFGTKRVLRTHHDTALFRLLFEIAKLWRILYEKEER